MDLNVVINKVKIVFVKFEDGAAGRFSMQNNRLALENRWMLIETFQASFGIKKNKPQSYSKRTQFPLKLKWACIVHKVQALSLNSGVLI